MKYLTYALITIGILMAISYLYLRPDVCANTQTYYIAQLDEEFGLSESELRAALTQAELVWEQPSFLNMFQYSQTRGDIAVRLVFDERQSETQAEANSRSELDKREQVIESNTALYNNLTAQLEEKELQYQINLNLYQSSPNQTLFNDIIRQEREINSLIRRINSLVSKIETSVDTFNSEAEQYNQSFSGVREFDQGHYDSRGEIVIYQYDNLEDLVLVLAHELGHAIGMGHVQSPKAIMNAFLTHQDTEALVAERADLIELESVCSPFIFQD